MMMAKKCERLLEKIYRPSSCSYCCCCLVSLCNAIPTVSSRTPNRLIIVTSTTTTTIIISSCLDFSVSQSVSLSVCLSVCLFTCCSPPWTFFLSAQSANRRSVIGFAPFFLSFFSSTASLKADEGGGNHRWSAILSLSFFCESRFGVVGKPMPRFLTRAFASFGVELRLLLQWNGWLLDDRFRQPKVVKGQRAEFRLFVNICRRREENSTVLCPGCIAWGISTYTLHIYVCVCGKERRNPVARYTQPGEISK